MIALFLFWVGDPDPIRLQALGFDWIHKSATQIEIIADQLLVLSNRDSCLFAYDLKTGESKTLIPKGQGPGEVYLPVRMAINGDNVAIKHEHGITLFNLSTGRPVSSFRISSPVSALYLSQEHVFLLTGSADKTMLQGYTYEGNHREGLFPYLDQYSAVKPQSQPMQGITQRLMMTGVIFEYDGVIGFVDNTLGNMAVYDRVRDSQRIETLLELYKPYGRKVKQLNGDFLQSGGVKSGELEMYKIWLAAKQVGKTLYCLEPGDPDHPGQPTLTAIRLVDKSKLFSRAIEVSAHGFFFHQQIPEINTMGPKLLRTQKFKVLGRERPHWKFTHWNT